MTDRVYPSTKPKANTKTTTTTTAPNQRLPPLQNKTQFRTPNTNLSNPNTNNRRTRTESQVTNVHRLNRSSRSRSRRCFCLCCFWSILIITLILLISSIAGCILYLLYHPQLPTFAIASLKIAQFNLTTTNFDDDITKLTSKLNVTLSTKNPNKKITFYYDPMVVTCLSHDTLIAKGYFPKPLISMPNNINIIHSSLHYNSIVMEMDTVNKLRADLKKKTGMKLKVVVDTEARVKVESLRSKKVGIRIKCEGIHSLVPKGGGKNLSSVAATVTAATCKVDLRIKIWKWTV